MMSMIRSLVVAWHFLTRIPIPRWPQAAIHHRDFARSMRWFPLIGMVIGLFLAGSDLVLSRVFAPSVANLLLIALLIVTTGGLHQDGLADTVDGLCGARQPEERLAIMKDGRIGAMAVIGLFLILGLRYAGLLTLPTADRFSVIAAMPVVGRWSMVVTAYGSRYPGSQEGLATAFLRELKARDLVWATGVCSIILLWHFEWVSVLILGMLIVGLARLLARGANAAFGGVTGDVLGATNELAEIVFLLLYPLLAINLDTSNLAG